MKFPSTVKVAAVPVPHIFEITNETSIAGRLPLSGFEGKMLNTLSDVLGFKYKFLYPSDGEIGDIDESGNWTGVMGLLQRKEADLGVSSLGMIQQRMQDVDFTNSYMTNKIQFLVEKPDALPAIWAFVYPFDTFLWIAVLITMVVIPIIFTYLLKFENSCITLFVHLFGLLLRQSPNMRQSSLKANFILSTWGIFALIISSSYSACLLSFLSIPLQSKPIRTFVDLAKAVEKGTHRCSMLHGVPMIFLLTNNKNENLIKLGEAVKANKWWYNIPDIMNPKLVVGRTAVIGIEINLQFLHGKLPPKTYDFSEDSLLSLKFGIAIRRGFCCRTALNTVISRMLSAGLIEKYQKDEWLKIRIAASKKFPVNKPTIHQLLIKDLYGIFVMLLTGYFLSFLVFLTEVYYFRIKV
ncbi:glutamate receptor ionotropic, kainate 5 [Trichonephila clavata]|uniref:Glutamate receptor ionotropic, kainate 5 n=1 Tax=Trichonephila clavata TaxID=2740835 RepID=A0A8X6KB68_TRICU|nr:glutamate receptor ionotropic, kainate 5 [Trichonephila clavata]